MKATNGVLDNEKMQAAFGGFILKVVNFEPVKTGVLDSFVYQPFKSFVSFGLFDTEVK